MLVIWSTGRQEYKLQLKIAIFRLYLQMLQSPGSERAGYAPARSVGVRDEVCPDSLRFTGRAKLVHGLSGCGFQDHAVCSPCRALVLLGIQERRGGFTTGTSLPDLIVLVGQHKPLKPVKLRLKNRK